MNPFPLHLCSNCFEFRSAHTDDAEASCPFAPTTFRLLLFTPHSDISDGNVDTIREELGVTSSVARRTVGPSPR